MSSRLVISLVASRSPTYTSGSQITREGALNIVRQAVAAGVNHISFAGTVGAVLDFTDPVIKAPLSDKAWNPLTEERALASGDGTLVYTVAKTQAEQALWKFAQEHPELSLTTSTSRISSITRRCP
jgi:nucleoside-diphosphate-sugar epimerase